MPDPDEFYLSVGSETSSLHRVGPPPVATIGAAAVAEGSGASARSTWGVHVLCSVSILPWLLLGKASTCCPLLSPVRAGSTVFQGVFMFFHATHSVALSFRSLQSPELTALSSF